MLISEALEGKYYRSHSRHLDGIIQFAERRDNVYTPENVYAYVIQVRPHWEKGNLKTYEDFYSTIYVKVDGE